MYSKDKILNKSVKLIIAALCISFSLLFIGYLQAADVDTLIQKLKDEDLIVRLHTVKALGESKDASAVKPLIDALGDKDCGCTASNALVTIGKPAVDSLIVALKDENPIVRRNATMVLGEIKDASAVKPLIFSLKDKDLTVRWNAAKALGKIKDANAVEPLIDALKDECPIVRKNAAIALRDMGKSGALIADILD